jgi:hypothetical protein
MSVRFASDDREWLSEDSWRYPNDKPGVIRFLYSGTRMPNGCFKCIGCGKFVRKPSNQCGDCGEGAYWV